MKAEMPIEEAINSLALSLKGYNAVFMSLISTLDQDQREQFEKSLASCLDQLDPEEVSGDTGRTITMFQEFSDELSGRAAVPPGRPGWFRGVFGHNSEPDLD